MYECTQADIVIQSEVKSTVFWSQH